jgi:hypothetical protein
MQWKRVLVWLATGMLVIAAFTGLVSDRFALPIILFVTAATLMVVVYWQSLKAFDFWAADEWVRTRLSLAGVRDWYPPYNAVEHFCDPKLVMGRNMAAAEMNAVMMELIKDPKSVAAKRNAAYDAAKIKHDQCNTALARALSAQLASGKLLAKGLPLRDDVTHSERAIPTAQWRILTLDIAKAEATGPGCYYSGIVIGKPARANTAKRSK